MTVDTYAGESFLVAGVVIATGVLVTVLAPLRS